jgi:hypothetical protein
LHYTQLTVECYLTPRDSEGVHSFATPIGQGGRKTMHQKKMPVAMPRGMATGIDLFDDNC